MGEERAVDLLTECLNDSHPEVRSHCAEALGIIGSPRAVPYLEEALDDPDPGVRQNVMRALEMVSER